MLRDVYVSTVKFVAGIVAYRLLRQEITKKIRATSGFG